MEKEKEYDLQKMKYKVLFKETVDENKRKQPAGRAKTNQHEQMIITDEGVPLKTVANFDSRERQVSKSSDTVTSLIYSDNPRDILHGVSSLSWSFRRINEKLSVEENIFYTDYKDYSDQLIQMTNYLPASGMSIYANMTKFEVNIIEDINKRYKSLNVMHEIVKDDNGGYETQYVLTYCFLKIKPSSR